MFVAALVAWKLAPTRSGDVAAGSSLPERASAGTAPPVSVETARGSERSQPEGAAAGGCSVCGTVTLDGSPLQGAEVTLLREEEFTTVETRTAAPDGTGRFCFAGLAVGFFRVSAWRPKVVPAGAKSFECTGDQALEFELALQTGDATIKGRVQGSDGAPVDGAQVIVFQDRNGTILRGSAVVPLDRGGFEVTVLAGAAYRIDATAPGYKFAGTTAKPRKGGTEEVTLVLKRETFIHGVVVAGGAPVEGARVTSFGHAVAPGAPVLTAPDGRFSLPAPLDKRFAISAVSGTRFGSTAVAALREDAIPQDVVIPLAEGRTVRGIVRLEDGTPQPLAEVFFRNRAVGLVGRVQAGLDGRFVIEGLPATASVELWANGGFHPKVVEPGTDEIELRLLPGRHALDGKN